MSNWYGGYDPYPDYMAKQAGKTPEPPDTPTTLVVNLFAGPGTGKSTNAALTFGKLKVRGISAEMAHEYAKDLTWEERHKAIRFQPYVAAKQIWRVHRLLDQVDVIITDSPILLSAIYQGDGYTKAFEEYIFDTFSSWNILNIVLRRDDAHHPYVQSGRSQTFDEAKLIDAQILDLLDREGYYYHEVPIKEGEETADTIVKLILEKLDGS